MIPALDGQKVCSMVEIDSKIDNSRFTNLMNRAANLARDRSTVLRKFFTGFARHGKSLIRGFESQDYNKDGLLNCDGFKAACLIPELGMPGGELEETFHLIANFNGQLSYKEWISDNFPILKESLTLTSAAREVTRPESTLTARDSINERSVLGGGGSISIGHETHANSASDANKVSSAKIKVENYIRSQDINLGVIFSILDTDSNKQITRVEFKQKLKAMHMRLDDEEISSLFKQLDSNSDGAVGYSELVEMFSAINTQQLIRKMQTVIQGSKVEPEFFFNRHCKSDGTQSRMSQEDFSRMVQSLYEKVTKAEITHVFRHFDKGRKGYITKQDFIAAFNSEVRETYQGFQISIEDIIKPLATKVRKLNANISKVFDDYDRNKNFRLSAEELSMGLRN